jgi:hypothetical protein
MAKQIAKSEETSETGLGPAQDDETGGVQDRG